MSCQIRETGCTGKMKYDVRGADRAYDACRSCCEHMMRWADWGCSSLEWTVNEDGELVIVEA